MKISREYVIYTFSIKYFLNILLISINYADKQILGIPDSDSTAASDPSAMRTDIRGGSTANIRPHAVVESGLKADALTSPAGGAECHFDSAFILANSSTQ